MEVICHFGHIAESNYYYIFTITSDIYTTLICFYDVKQCTCSSTERTPFNIFYKSGLVVMDSLSCCFFGKIFIPLFLKDSFTGYRIFDWQLLSFFPGFSWKVSVEKSTDSLWGFRFYVTVLFSLAAFKFFIFDFLQFNYNISQCSPLWFNIFGILWAS